MPESAVIAISSDATKTSGRTSQSTSMLNVVRLRPQERALGRPVAVRHTRPERPTAPLVVGLLLQGASSRFRGDPETYGQDLVRNSICRFCSYEQQPVTLQPVRS